MNAVANRKPFSYDLSNDTLFQQAKEQYQNMGKVAMADTVPATQQPQAHRLIKAICNSLTMTSVIITVWH